MRHFIGCDAHKKYSVFVAIDETGNVKPAVRVNHDRELYRGFLRGLPAGSEIAVETIGNWYWIVDEMEEAGHRPRLAHARKSKLMMGEIDKTDKLYALIRRPRNWVGASSDRYSGMVDCNMPTPIPEKSFATNQ